MGEPAARILDYHSCPAVTGTTPHVGGPISEGSATVLIEMMASARIGDKCTCAVDQDTIVTGSSTVMIEGRPAARRGDRTAHGGVILAGAPTVTIGD